MISLNKPADHILTDLINQSNAEVPGYRAYAYGTLQFRNPQAVVDGQRTTSIEVTDMPAPNESDWIRVYYNRVPLTRIFNRIDPILPWGTSTPTTHQLLSAINARFGVQLTADDVENDTIAFDAGLEQWPFTVAIRSKTTSKIFQGTASLTLINPNIGEGSILPVDTSTVANLNYSSLADDFVTPEGGYIFEPTATKFFGNFSTNREVGISVLFIPVVENSSDLIVDSSGGSESTFGWQFTDGERWVLALCLESYNQDAGRTFFDDYDVRWIVEASGEHRFDMRLAKQGNQYYLLNQDGRVFNTRVFASANGLNLTFCLDPTGDDGAAYFTFANKSTDGYPYGNFRSIARATRRRGNYPEMHSVVNLALTYQASEAPGGGGGEGGGNFNIFLAPTNPDSMVNLNLYETSVTVDMTASFDFAELMNLIGGPLPAQIRLSLWGNVGYDFSITGASAPDIFSISPTGSNPDLLINTAALTSDTADVYLRLTFQKSEVFDESTQTFIFDELEVTLTGVISGVPADGRNTWSFVLQ